MVCDVIVSVIHLRESFHSQTNYLQDAYGGAKYMEACHDAKGP